jgi:hypothetical protein
MRSRLRASLAIGVVLAPLSVLAAACSSAPPEQQVLNQFFRAARTRDNETLARMSAVEFDPREQGEISRFDITNISEERRTPLDYKSLMEAQRKATEAELEFRKARVEFESANRPALEAIAKLEREPNARFNAGQQKLKAEWDKWRAEAPALQKAVSTAKTAWANAVGPAEASLAQPGLPAFSAETFEGQLVQKDVTLTADVRKDGQSTPKTLVVTLQRVEGTQAGTARIGRWIIARIQGA